MKMCSVKTKLRTLLRRISFQPASDVSDELSRYADLAKSKWDTKMTLGVLFAMRKLKISSLLVLQQN